MAPATPSADIAPLPLPKFQKLIPIDIDMPPAAATAGHPAGQAAAPGAGIPSVTPAATPKSLEWLAMTFGTVLIVLAVSVLPIVLMAWSGYVVFYYDNADAAVSLGALLSLCAGVMLGFVGLGSGESGSPWLGILILIGGIAGAAFFLNISIRNSFIDNAHRNKIFAVIIGVLKVAVAWWIMLWIFEGANRILGKAGKGRGKGAMSGVAILGLMAMIYKILCNGEQVYKKLGRPLR